MEQYTHEKDLSTSEVTGIEYVSAVGEGSQDDASDWDASNAIHEEGLQRGEELSPYEQALKHMEDRQSERQYSL